MAVEEYIGTFTQKGQVTIPLSVRKALGLEPGDQVLFRVSAGRVELLPGPMTLEAVFGAVKPIARPENWKEIRRIAREERVLTRL